MKLTKKQIVILSIVLLFLLIAFSILGFNSFWAVFVLLPMIFCVDVCYLTLPVTVSAMVGLSIYSHVKKDFVKFNKVYEFLAFMITIGFIDIYFEKSLINIYGSYSFDPTKAFIYTLFLIFFILNIVFVTRKNDTRMFTYGFLPVFLLCLLYRYLELVG